MRDVFRVAGDDYARMVNWLVLDEDAAWMGEDGVVESETLEILSLWPTLAYLGNASLRYFVWENTGLTARV